MGLTHNAVPSNGRGSPPVDGPAFRACVSSLTGNLAYHGIDRVVFVRAHGGNTDHLYEVGRQLREDGVCFALRGGDESIPELVDDRFEHNSSGGPPAGPAPVAARPKPYPCSQPGSTIPDDAR